MSSKATSFLAGGAVVVLALAVLLATHELGFGRPLESGVPGMTRAHPYLLEDTYDRLAFQQRGRWLASGGTPYLDEFSEYPQISTWLMGLPYLVIPHEVERGEPHTSIRTAWGVLEAGGVEPEVARELAPLPPAKMPEALAVAARLAGYPSLDRPAARSALERARAASERRDAEIVATREAYGNAHHVLMAGWFLVLLAVTIKNLKLLGSRPTFALLLFCPATLYFGFNRFDLVVTSLVALAIHFELKGRRCAAAAFLGAAIMTKWSPIVLLPLFLAYNVRALRAAGGPWKTALLRGAVLPGALVTAIVIGVLGITFVWHGGGMEAVRFVFDWHKNVRQPNHSSLLALLSNPERWGLFDAASRPALEQLFKLLQLAPAVLLALFPLRSRRALLAGALSATLCSIVFSEFFSPQWVIWITALGLLLAPRSPLLLVLLVALEVVMYLQLPYFWYAAQASSDFDAFWTVTSLRMILLLVLLAFALVLFAREVLRPTPDALPAA